MLQPSIARVCLLLLIVLSTSATAQSEDSIDPWDEFAYLLTLPEPQSRWEGWLSLDNTGPDERRDRERLSVTGYLGSERQGQLQTELETDHALDYRAAHLALRWPTMWPAVQWQASFSSSQNRFRLVDTQSTFQDDQSQWQLMAAFRQTLASYSSEREWQVLLRQIHTDTSQTGLNGLLYQHRHTLPGLSVQQSHQKWATRLHGQATLLYHWGRFSTVDTLTLPNVARLALPQRFWLLQAQFHAEHRLGNHRWRWAGGLQTSFGTRLLPVFQGSLDGMYRVRGYPDGVNSGDDLLWLRSDWLPWSSQSAQRDIATYLHLDVGWLQNHAAELTTQRPAVQQLFTTLLPSGSQTLASAGGGLDVRWQAWHLALNLSCALRADALTTQRGDWRVHGWLAWQF